MSVLEKGIWAAAAVLFGGSLAHGAVGGPVAAEEDLRSLLPLSLEELIATPIVTASRRRESRAQTPAHIMVITREQIRDRRYKNLADLLEDLPGVDFQRGTRSTQYNNFVFQGHVSNNKGASDFPVDGEHGNSRPDRSPFGFSGVRRRSFELACRVLIPQTSTALMRCRIALACNIRRY